jgi:hypothetical protein
MKNLLKVSKSLAVASLILITLLVLPQVGFAAQGTSLSIPVAAFTEDGFSATSNYNKNQTQGDLEVFSGSGCFCAPVEFPSNATRIATVKVFIVDQSPVNATFSIHRIRLPSGLDEQVGTVNSAGSSPDLQNLSMTLVADKKAITGDYAYQVWACLPTDAKFFGARVFYGTD